MGAEVLSKHPWIGMGFGVPFLPTKYMKRHFVDTDQFPLPNVDPHNSHMSVLYRMGIVGMLLYVGFLSSLILTSLRTIRNRDVPELRRFLLAVTISYVLLVLAHACFAVVLEGPYMGVPFWM